MEALVALALLGLVIGILADLASKYSHLIAFSRSKDNTNVAAAALERMGRECEQSVGVLNPAVGASVDALQIELVDTDSPLRTQGLTDWEPNRVSDRLDVQYELRERDLVRIETGTAGTTESVLVSGIDGLIVSHPDDRQVRIELSTREKLRVVTFVTTAFRWVR